MRSVGPEPEHIPRVQVEGASVLRHEMAGVVEAVGGVDPAVSSIAQAAAHPVGVLLIAERPEQHFAQVTGPVTIGVGEIPEIGDAPRDASIAVFRFVPGEDSGGNV